MAIMIGHYLQAAPSNDLEQLLEQYAEALWIEERQAIIMANAVTKAFNGK